MAGGDLRFESGHMASEHEAVIGSQRFVLGVSLLDLLIDCHRLRVR